MEVASELARYSPAGDHERRDVAELLSLIGDGADPWDRALPLHLTGSALVIDFSTPAPAGPRVLLRWHARLGGWFQVGGHGDPGESSGLEVALREAEEETGLVDLRPVVFGPIHVAVVDVPSGKGEPAHRHGDLRYLLATKTPELVRPENALAALRWLSFEEALDASVVRPGESLRSLLERGRMRVAGA